jgi:hypothetical protein
VIIRIDDFPIGDPRLKKLLQRDQYRSIVKSVTDIFIDLEYILGVTPFSIIQDDLPFLNEVNRVVMHGFDHALSCQYWKDITKIWPTGGEFGLYTRSENEAKLKSGIYILSNVKNFSPVEFVPPFNCVNQDILDLLNIHGFKRIYLCDKEFDAYGYDKMDFGQLEKKISTFGFDYSGINTILKNFPKFDKDAVITLHWCFDMKIDNWLDKYKQLAKLVKCEKN